MYLVCLKLTPVQELCIVCVDITQPFFFFFAQRDMRDMRAARAPHSQYALAAVAAPCSIPVLSRFALIVAFTPGLRRPTPISCAYWPNEFLYQFGVQSVQPFGRQCWIGGALRSRRLRRPVPSLYSRASRSFSRGTAAPPGLRTPTP
jgi:hypothetical protein